MNYSFTNILDLCLITESDTWASFSLSLSLSLSLALKLISTSGTHKSATMCVTCFYCMYVRIIIYRSQVSAWIQNKSHSLRPENEACLVYLSSLKVTNYLLVQHVTRRTKYVANEWNILNRYRMAIANEWASSNRNHSYTCVTKYVFQRVGFNAIAT